MVKVIFHMFEFMMIEARHPSFSWRQQCGLSLVLWDRGADQRFKRLPSLFWTASGQDVFGDLVATTESLSVHRVHDSMQDCTRVAMPCSVCPCSCRVRSIRFLKSPTPQKFRDLSTT